MPDIVVDKTTPLYTARHVAFQQVQDFLRDNLIAYLELDKEGQALWRQNDEFLDAVLTWVETITEGREYDL